MTIASSFLPSTKPAHEVSPMNGGIFQPSTVTGKSLRGALTLNTPSAALHVPDSPVICAMRFVSSAALAVKAIAAAMASTEMILLNSFVLIALESSLASECQVVEQRHAVGLRPNADRSCVLEYLI